MHGLARGGEDAVLVRCAVRFEVFLAAAGEGGGCGCGGEGGGVGEVGEEAEVLRFVAEVVVLGVGRGRGVGWRGGGVFVEVSHLEGRTAWALGRGLFVEVVVLVAWEVGVNDADGVERL